MTRSSVGAALRLFGVGAMLFGAASFAGVAAAQQDEDSGSLIDADVIADIEVRGGDAQGGDAVGGDAGLVAAVAGTGSDECGCGGDVSIEQEAGVLEGGDAVGGDAAGGDGLNAFVDAVLVVDADVNLDVSADVTVNTVVGADLDLDPLPLPLAAEGTVDAQGDLAVPPVVVPPVNPGDVQLPDGTLDMLQNPLGSLGGLAGISLLDLFVDIDLVLEGGDAVGGDAAGGNALLQATVADTVKGSVTIEQEVGTVLGGDATGGEALGGDGIELDVILDADIDLVVDAVVDITADVTTIIEADLTTGGLGNRAGGMARLGRFSTLEE